MSQKAFASQFNDLTGNFSYVIKKRNRMIDFIFPPV
ncbi:hypothetical protein RSAG8_03667, partial [Rhizoctonia solani AG-8 WAC10335]